MQNSAIYQSHKYKRQYKRIKLKVKQKYKDETIEFSKNTSTYIENIQGYNSARDAWKMLKNVGQTQTNIPYIEDFRGLNITSVEQVGTRHIFNDFKGSANLLNHFNRNGPRGEGSH